MSRGFKTLMFMIASMVVLDPLGSWRGLYPAAAAAVAPSLEAVACATVTTCVAVGGAHDLLISENGGRTWSVQSYPGQQYLYGVACISSTRCIAVGDAGAVFISGKNGRDWIRVSSGTKQPLSSVSCPGSARCYAAGDGGTVLTTDDSGSSWKVVTSGSSVIDGVACVTPLECAAVTSNSELDLYTQDGNNWMSAKVQSAALLALFPMNGIACSQAFCMAVGNHGLLARSTDRGVSWSFLYEFVTAKDLDAVDCPRPTRCIAAGANGTILTSNDGGLTWNRRRSPTDQTLLGITCMTARDCLAVGNGSTVISTFDDGSHWNVRYGNAGPKMARQVLVVGDSFAHTLALYLGRNASAYGVSFVDGGLDGCGLARGNTLGNPGGALGVVQAVSGPCAATGPGWPSVYRENVSRYRPSLSLLVLGPWDLSTRLVDGRWIYPGQAAYDDYYRHQVATAVHVLTSDGGRVVITTVPNVHSSGGEPCAPFPTTVAKCPTEPQRVAALNAVARQVAVAHPSLVTLINLGQRLSPGGRYDRRINGVTVRAADGVHLSEPGGEWLAPWLIPRLLADGTGQNA